MGSNTSRAGVTTGFAEPIEPRARLLWSWLLAARNDHYQGSPEERLSTSLRVLVQGTEEHQLKDATEILVVDWNSELPFHRAQCHAPFRTLLRGLRFAGLRFVRFAHAPCVKRR